MYHPRSRYFVSVPSLQGMVLPEKFIHGITVHALRAKGERYRPTPRASPPQSKPMLLSPLRFRLKSLGLPSTGTATKAPFWNIIAPHHHNNHSIVFHLCIRDSGIPTLLPPDFLLCLGIETAKLSQSRSSFQRLYTFSSTEDEFNIYEAPALLI